MIVLLGLGFSSGLPYLLTSQTLQAWLDSLHVDLGRIAAFAAIGLAYTLKFAWAPLLDRFRLPWLGRRRGWALVLQLALIAAIVALGQIDPRGMPVLLAGAALAVALLSASQDVVLDAYAAEILEPHERAAGQAVYVLGYRIGTLVAGSVALVLADHVSWPVIYGAMASLLAIGVLATLAAEEPHAAPSAPLALIEPLRDLPRRLGGRAAARLLAFAALYEFGYFFAQAIIIPFLHDGAGFEFTEIGTAYKLLVFAGTAIGGIASGALVARTGARRVLVAFGLVAAATHLLYALLASIGHSLPMLCVAVLVDSIANALVMTVFYAIAMGAISRTYSATQLAVLTALSSIGKSVFGPLAASVQAAVGWPGFFMVTAALTLPGLVVAGLIAREVATGEQHP